MKRSRKKNSAKGSVVDRVPCLYLLAHESGRKIPAAKFPTPYTSDSIFRRVQTPKQVHNSRQLQSKKVAFNLGNALVAWCPHAQHHKSKQKAAPAPTQKAQREGYEKTNRHKQHLAPALQNKKPTVWPVHQ